MAYRLALIPVDALDSGGRADGMVYALLSDRGGRPDEQVLEALDALSASAAGQFAIDRPADSRGAVVSAPGPEGGVLRALLAATKDRQVAVYDLQTDRLYDPRGRVDVRVGLPGRAVLPYLTRALLRDLVLRPIRPSGSAPLVVVERDDDEFIQAHRDDGGTYRIENRDGGPESHFTFHTADGDLVVDVIWGWTTQNPLWHNVVEWTPLDLEKEGTPTKQRRHVVLQNERRGDGSSLHMSAALEADGSLEISGQDLGPVTQSMSDDGEYEWFYTVAAEDVPALVVALGGQRGDDIIDLLEQRWSGKAAYGLGKALRSSRVKHGFFSYP